MRLPSGNQWFLPERTSTQLGDLRTVASAEDDRRIVDGICVTSWTIEQDNSGNIHHIPCSSFRIEERLVPVGGLSAALATCRACEANGSTLIPLISRYVGLFFFFPRMKAFGLSLRTLDARGSSTSWAMPVTVMDVAGRCDRIW